MYNGVHVVGPSGFEPGTKRLYMFETEGCQRKGNRQFQLNVITLMFSMVYEVIFFYEATTDRSKQNAQNWPRRNLYT